MSLKKPANLLPGLLVAVVVAVSLAVPAWSATLEQARMAVRTRDFAKAFRLSLELAKRGDAEAQYTVATLYRAGLGTAKDEGRAVTWFRRAAKQGNADAQYCLGVMYLRGAGVKRNREEGLRWLSKAAVQGNAMAASKLEAELGTARAGGGAGKLPRLAGRRAAGRGEGLGAAARNRPPGGGGAQHPGRRGRRRSDPPAPPSRGRPGPSASSPARRTGAARAGPSGPARASPRGPASSSEDRSP